MCEHYNEALGLYGMNIGLSNEDLYAGTWEWFERKTQSYKAGFKSAVEAYESAVQYLKDSYDIELVLVSDDEPTYSGNLDYRGSEPDMGMSDEVIYGFDNRHRRR